MDFFLPEDWSVTKGWLEGALWRQSALRCVYIGTAMVEVIFIGFQNTFQEIVLCTDIQNFRATAPSALISCYQYSRTEALSFRRETRMFDTRLWWLIAGCSDFSFVLSIQLEVLKNVLIILHIFI